MEAAVTAENHEDSGINLIFTLRIYTSIPTWTHSQNSLAAEALNLRISSGKFLKNSCKLFNETGHSALSSTKSQSKLRQHD